jgi:hypothetical protein
MIVVEGLRTWRASDVIAAAERPLADDWNRYSRTKQPLGVPESRDFGVGVSILSYARGLHFGTDAKMSPDPEAILARFARVRKSRCGGRRWRAGPAMSDLSRSPA